MALTTELNSLFDSLSKQSASNPDNGVEGIITAPLEQSAPVAPQAPTTTPNVEPTVVAPVAPQAPITQPEPPKDIDLSEDWFGNPQPAVSTPVEPTNQPQFDFSELAKVLGQETIKSKEDLVSAITAYKSKAELLANIPEQMAKAIEIANSNGDYLSYLGVSQIDWAKEDPVTLYENYVMNSFTDPNTGVVDFEKVDKLLDKIEDDEKELRGRELQRSYIERQTLQKQQIEREARAQKQAFEQNLKRSIESLTDVNGYKLTQAHKNEIYDYILKGEDLKANDISRRVQNAFITKYFNKIDDFRKSQIRNLTKKEILEEAVMPQVTPVASAPDAQTPQNYNLGSFLKELESKQKKRF